MDMCDFLVVESQPILFQPQRLTVYIVSVPDVIQMQFGHRETVHRIGNSGSVPEDCPNGNGSFQVLDTLFEIAEQEVRFPNFVEAERDLRVIATVEAIEFEEQGFVECECGRAIVVEETVLG